MTLSSLIFDVRSNLSDLPEEFASDSQVFRDLVSADAFVSKVAPSEADGNYRNRTIIALATYYTYVNYTSRAEKNLGTLPPTAVIRVNALREIAASFLTMISEVPLTPELAIDMNKLNTYKGAGIAIIDSILDE